MDWMGNRLLLLQYLDLYGHQRQRCATHTDGSDVFPAGTESSLELDGTMKSYKIAVNVGDLVDVGRFRNVQAKIKGIEIDEHGQPVIITTKGKKKLFSLRLTKLTPGAKTPKQILTEKHGKRRNT
tara:strand:- start:152 stop:526 length:375 start_codon:yes stop_codon:yes gene_type:complete